ncbi:GlsB/YeaQ/YmgE family stress response membrane protein [Falsarthrobacter nasiphocae]|uniref:Membrane protein YeaQ/YmgE (Transglycosylase-associated protein family) n=1 Tax=Falsarthrobacter nasiphocae TaxID=189863 RepID=A0AAE4C6G6_9MICC|nr:GlsB/YeaQ/YmgE family stress response membrane protein [Falsarthrobacter nasiphocae]MDR6892147.1 putative membrane protein YeaQ/YmgE (transglycosylase-associated protein family) [Falsarthrobacter nasiphocae]
MNFLVWLIVGLVAGALAKLIMPGKQGGGFLATMILGVIGAFVGGFIGSAIFNINTNSGFNMATLFWAVIGSLIVSFAWGAFQRRKG